MRTILLFTFSYALSGWLMAQVQPIASFEINGLTLQRKDKPKKKTVLAIEDNISVYWITDIDTTTGSRITHSINGSFLKHKGPDSLLFHCWGNYAKRVYKHDEQQSVHWYYYSKDTSRLADQDTTVIAKNDIYTITEGRNYGSPFKPISGLSLVAAFIAPPFVINYRTGNFNQKAYYITIAASLGLALISACFIPLTDSRARDLKRRPTSLKSEKYKLWEIVD